MGFLKFLKKKKEEMPLDESLDAPPKPPSIKEELPEPPKFEEEKLPEELPPFKFREEKPMPTNEEKLPPLPEFGEKLPEMPKEPELEIPFPPVEEKPSFVPKPPLKESVMEVPLPKIELPKTIKPERPFHERMGERAVREERRLLRGRPISEPLYIRLEKFKETLKNVSISKSDLKKSDEILLNLIKSKEEKDKEFEKWHTIMEDIQKKLIFIEKTLFKGD